MSKGEAQPGNKPVKIGIKLRGSDTVFWLTVAYGEVVTVNPATPKRLIDSIQASTDYEYIRKQ